MNRLGCCEWGLQMGGGGLVVTKTSLSFAQYLQQKNLGNIFIDIVL